VSFKQLSKFPGSTASDIQAVHSTSTVRRERRCALRT